MEDLQIARKDMASLLLSLKENAGDSPNEILYRIWKEMCLYSGHEKGEFESFVSTVLPPVFYKLLKADRKNVGFSINEVVSLGNKLAFTNLTPTAVQNWVKRDVKELIGSPQRGKKYAVEQAAILLIVEDLKTVLDFESIRRLLKMLFNNPADRTDDLMDPIDFYLAYSTIFEKIDELMKMSGDNPDYSFEKLLEREAAFYTAGLPYLNTKMKKNIDNAIVIAILAVQTAYFQSLARNYSNTVSYTQHHFS
ncbi:DUF1836 domain-containing protein [Pseudalkalibacillus caeni]|uniref:DUF1836 domain-containing protein n=1 Tax=Exobacillus caeni TaxID=2574798 RepID=A0A5R9F3I5_9BACL|nr:DUF1836 domain-containing protein [Pseudalkalibacillus caeni]TLS38167.1 DUF1836 domain-containing protein [Pseudalkalibacillus caeni]